MKQRRWFFYALVFLQLLFLILMSVSYYAMDLWGKTITLKTAPVDPRDPFYGDYVRLNYDIEQIPEEKWKGEETVDRGEKVFLLLEENEEGIYELVEASTIWPEKSDGQVVLSSKYQTSASALDQYQVDIGLGKYYIEENTGAIWEQREERTVEVVLAPWKQKKIVSLK
ncbi:Uncharacterized membrane-anchored protein [Halobacillus karajensis]|uniref:Membrane-anchored protein n=1 Tax=Halobacillus karajensis TaxID=195088 RepID=A0A024P6X4_9BACI|nr:GDYXXLXY domain-containing protein [Halobacillus karajensis]CDQ21067.1 putative membrane-anchored protein [Halobacillus karajensis]CDQ24869.1 putative membrane-anchored protein [Halobacillus karajensis]CDQ28771.1 putative membrane-anchored protein [Halobacillus karajensis]SEH96637.1 Uncharacterized membrane-anchored protein [Halobacillus karajensis]